LKLQTAGRGWEIDAVTSINVKSPYSTINAVDLRLPQPRPRGLGLIGTAAPWIPFPGTIPWAGVLDNPWAQTDPDEFTVQDELGNSLRLAPLEAGGKTRVLLERIPAPKEVTLKLRSKIRIPADSRRIRLELPRPIGTQDRGAKVTILADERTELLHGPAGAEEPLPERHLFAQSLDQSPGFVDVAWQPYQRALVGQSEIDVTLHENSAQVKQVLRFPRDQAAAGADGKNALVALKVPPGIERVTLAADGTSYRAQETLWLPAGGDAKNVELVLLYDRNLTNHLLQVTPIQSAHVSQQEIKVRVWTAPGVKARLADDQTARGVWKERSVEIVPGKDQFPALVLHGYGSNLPLALRIEDAAANTLAAFVADRALIEVRLSEDGGHYKARYHLHEIHAPHVDIELPLPLSRFPARPAFSIGGRPTTASPLDKTENVVRVKLYPDLVKAPTILEIDYTIPTDAMERNSFWRTTLQPPGFRSNVVIAEMRWQLTLGRNVIAAVPGRNVTAYTQCSLQNWLPAPESSVTRADWDRWLTDKESAQEPAAVTCSFAYLTTQSLTVYHLQRPWCLAVCSGLFVILALGSYFSPLPRFVFWALLLLLVLAVLSLGVFAPAVLPAVLYGLQPGIVLFVIWVGTHWFLRQRARGEFASESGFSPAKPSSTMVRTSAAMRPREASTVDAPVQPTPAEAEEVKSSPSGS
jgi:hypothetical protein